MASRGLWSEGDIGGCLWITVHLLPSSGKTTKFKVARLAAEGCLELYLAAGSIFPGIETLHYVVRTIINGC